MLYDAGLLFYDNIPYNDLLHEIWRDLYNAAELLHEDWLGDDDGENGYSYIIDYRW